MPQPTLNVVGHCSATTARLLVVAESAGVARLALRAGDVVLPHVDRPLAMQPPCATVTFVLEGLPPGARIQYAVDVADRAEALRPAGELLENAAQSFRLLPENRPPRIALLSCNGIETAPEAERFTMWRRLQAEIDAGRIDLLIHAGDQVYGDHFASSIRQKPGFRKMGPGDAAAMATLEQGYRQIYLDVWANEEIRSVLASCPSVMMWDDHEVYDGWGSHDTDGTPSSQAFFRAGRAAFETFQAALNPPLGQGRFSADSFGFASRFGALGLLVPDARSNRRYTEGRVLDAAQWSAIEQWLEGMAGAKLRRLYVVLGIPIIHINAAALLHSVESSGVWKLREEIDDLRDAWVSPGNRPECARLLEALFTFRKRSPGTDVTILSGDVHVATIARIWSTAARHQLRAGSPPTISQVVSSGIGTAAPTGFQLGIVRQLTAAGTLQLGSPEFLGCLDEVAGSPEGKVLASRNFAGLALGDPQDPGGGEWSRGNDLTIELWSEGRAHPLVQIVRGDCP